MSADHVAVFLCYGNPDECQNCGGSATLGNTQQPYEDEAGRRFCSDDCREEMAEFIERDKARHVSDWCPTCGYDNHEHGPTCAVPSASGTNGEPE